MATPKSGNVPSARPSATKTIVITGAGRGLGLALARACVERGDRVIGTLRDRTRDEGLMALATTYPTRVQVLPLDVGDDASCAALGREVAALTDHVDVLINNAGINSSSPEVAGPERARELERLEADALVTMLQDECPRRALRHPGPASAARRAMWKGRQRHLAPRLPQSEGDWRESRLLHEQGGAQHGDSRSRRRPRAGRDLRGLRPSGRGSNRHGPARCQALAAGGRGRHALARGLAHARRTRAAS